MLEFTSDEERDEYVDVLGSGGLLYKKLKETNGSQAEFGEEVTITYSEWLLDTKELVTENEERKFRIGHGEVMPAIELVTKLMRAGEIMDVRCESRFAYGEIGRLPTIPIDANMRLQIELNRVGKRITSDLNVKELLEEAIQKKDNGNRYYQDKNYDQAAKLYKRALKTLEIWGEAEGCENEELQIECKKVLVALGNNVANVQFKLNEFAEARASSLEVLQLDPSNIKAMYRLAQLALQESEFADAMRYLMDIYAIDKNNRQARELMAQVRVKKAEWKEKEKKLYKNLGRSETKVNTGNDTSDAITTKLYAGMNLQIILISAIILLLSVGIASFYALKW